MGYALDGAALSNSYDSTGFPLTFPDALQEFKVETSSLTAMNGTHSGSNAFGNVGVFSLAGPSFWELDTALSRIFRIGERHSLEARWEAINITNSKRPFVTTPGNPINPFNTLNSGTSGQITQSYDPRIMQFAMKYVFCSVSQS